MHFNSKSTKLCKRYIHCSCVEIINTTTNKQGIYNIVCFCEQQLPCFYNIFHADVHTNAHATKHKYYEATTKNKNSIFMRFVWSTIDARTANIAQFLHEVKTIVEDKLNHVHHSS